MPLFGLLPYDDERRRRAGGRILPPGVTPINPDASAPVSLPNLPAPRRLPLLPLAREIPGGVMPGAPGPGPSPLPETAVPTAMPLPAAGVPGSMPAPNPTAGVTAATLPGQSRGQQVQGAREAYMAGTPGRGKSALLGLARGALGGLASGQGLGGLIGGAATGAVLGGATPRTMRELEFEERVKPKILEGFAYEDADTAQRMATEKAKREGRLADAQIAGIESEVGARTAAQNLPMIIPQGATAIDKRTGKPIATNEREAQPRWEATSEGIKDLNAPENKGRTFQPYSKPAEPPPQVMTQLQQLKKSATTAWAMVDQTPDGPDKELARQKAQAALDAYNNAVEQFGLTYGDSFETGQGKGGWAYHKRRGAPAQSTGAKPQAQQGDASATRSRSQFNSKKFPGLKFD